MQTNHNLKYYAYLWWEGGGEGRGGGEGEMEEGGEREMGEGRGRWRRGR